jgi:hypothetical protein
VKIEIGKKLDFGLKSELVEEVTEDKLAPKEPA